MITILDYGAGNLQSVRNTLDEVGASYSLTRDARELARAFREYDVLATAGWMTPAEPAQPDQLDKFLRPPNITTPFNIGGGPAMNIPCGCSREGLPLSLQLAGAHFAEPLLFRVGHAYQQMTDWHTQHPTAGMIQ